MATGRNRIHPRGFGCQRVCRLYRQTDFLGSQGWDQVQDAFGENRVGFLVSGERRLSFFPVYEPVPAPEAGQFRLTVGRCALHTHVSTQNNPYLNEIVPENLLWINSAQAAKLGISNGMRVEVRSAQGAGLSAPSSPTSFIPKRCSCSMDSAMKPNLPRDASRKDCPTAFCRRISRTRSAAARRSMIPLSR